MSEEFWWGVIITLIVGLPGAYVMSVFAHMHAPRFNQFLESRRLLKKTKTRKHALQLFNRVRDFKTGKRDRYAFYILSGTAAIVCSIFASTLFVIFSVHSGDKYPISIEYGMVLL